MGNKKTAPGTTSPPIEINLPEVMFAIIRKQTKKTEIIKYKGEILSG